MVSLLSLVAGIVLLVIWPGLCRFTLLTLDALAVTFSLAFAVFTLLLVAALVDLALGFRQHAQIVFGMLLEILGGYAIIAKLCVAGQLIILFNDLLRCAAHFSLRARAVENAVYDIAALRLTVARILGPGP